MRHKAFAPHLHSRSLLITPNSASHTRRQEAGFQHWVPTPTLKQALLCLLSLAQGSCCPAFSLVPQVETWRTVKLAPAWQRRDRSLPCVLEALYPRLALASSHPHLHFSNVYSCSKGVRRRVLMASDPFSVLKGKTATFNLMTFISSRLP